MIDSDFMNRLKWLLDEGLAYHAHHKTDCLKYIVCLDNNAYVSYTGNPLSDMPVDECKSEDFKVRNPLDLVLYIPSPSAKYFNIIDDGGPTMNLAYVHGKMSICENTKKRHTYAFVKRAFNDARQENQDNNKHWEKRIVDAVLEFLDKYSQYVKDRINNRKDTKRLTRFHIPFATNQEFRYSFMDNAASEVSNILGVGVKLSCNEDDHVLQMDLIG
jgi:hypothetical protein